MATSDVDIVNMALAHLGDGAIVTSITPSDGSAQADAAARAYPHLRNWLLERFPWKFALRRETLAQRDDLSISSWLYAYAEPNLCVRVVNILPGGYTSDEQGVEYETETDSTGQGIILTNAPDAVCRFIAQIDDPGKFTPGFTEALSWFLAASLAGPIIKGETGRAEAIRCVQMATLAFASATGLSANQARKRLDYVPSNIAARGGFDAADELPLVIRSV